VHRENSVYLHNKNNNFGLKDGGDDIPLQYSTSHSEPSVHCSMFNVEYTDLSKNAAPIPVSILCQLYTHFNHFSLLQQEVYDTQKIKLHLPQCHLTYIL